MKAEFVNPFLIECQNLFKEAAAIDLTYKGTSVKTATISTKNVAVMIGVTGHLVGTIIMNLDTSFAKKIASNMMGGMEIKELDELSKSAIAELGNMIMGRVSTNFSYKGIHIDITPPSLITGENIKLSSAVTPILSIKYAFDNYELDFDISIKEKM